MRIKNIFLSPITYTPAPSLGEGVNLSPRVRGQVMILTVLTLGSTILGATTIAGLLMLYQIRQSTDLANSGRAVFAADAGVEWALYNFECSLRAGVPCSETAKPVFSNRATLDAVCYDHCGAPTSCTSLAVLGDSCSGAYEVRSVGTAGSASRAFRNAFE